MDERDEARRDLRARFEAELEGRVDRHLRAKRWQITPSTHFSEPAAECIEAFISGEFYNCIAGCQSVAEALARFLAKANGVRRCKDYLVLVDRLQAAGVISPEAQQAFRVIRREDRNDHHHLNEGVEQDIRRLEARSVECLDALHAIESEVFAYTFDEGRLVLRNPRYWPDGGEPGTVLVHLRSL